RDLRLHCQLFVDDALDRFDRLRSAQHATVDEERRRAVHARLLAGPGVGVDLRLVLVRVDAAVELRGVEAELYGMLLEVGVGEARRAGEELVVIRPEFALFSRALRRFRGRPRVRVTWERKVTVDEMDAIAVGAEHLLDRRISALAVGTLEIGELDNLDRRRL